MWSSIIDTVSQLSLFHPFSCGAQLLIQLVNYHCFICSITKFNYWKGWSIIIISSVQSWNSIIDTVSQLALFHPFSCGAQLLIQLLNYHCFHLFNYEVQLLKGWSIIIISTITDTVSQLSLSWSFEIITVYIFYNLFNYSIH